MSARVEHTDVGAYALGLLEADDKRAFEAHLATCPACTAELAELSGMAGVLTGVGPIEPDVADEPGEARVVDLLRRRKAADRRTRRGTLVIGVAAAVTLVAGGIAVGAGLGPSPQPIAEGAHHPGAGPAEQFYEEGTPAVGTSTSGVRGGVVYESKKWGTHAALKLEGVKGPLECELIAVAKNGARKSMTGWAVPPPGYGVEGQPNPLYMHGGSAWSADQIDRFEVVTSTGLTLLTVDI
ncbi:anti-sigma factor family protein [Nonomuraea typhae]|uniref:anti-sigma factor family protein n=1 Tax=Nonomuraea typhae TaxID=2603600 RepID=UPI0012FC3CD5|nr:zf-HC2 domain-containing protein [Nonomuraea typhae]